MTEMAEEDHEKNQENHKGIDTFRRKPRLLNREHVVFNDGWL